MSELELTDEQVSMESTGTTGDALEGQGELSDASNQTTASGPDGMAEESFFDPKDVIGTPLEAAYKQMQSAFTKKMQSFSGNQQAIDAYNQFMSNPQGTLQQLAQQYGYQLTQPGQQQQEETEFQPQTWDEVMERARKEVMKDLEPVIGEVQQMKKSNMETFLDNNFQDWRTYEDKMISLLNEHPTLSKNPEMLYNMALPEEVKQARAHKAALAKINGQANSSQVSGASKTTKKPSQQIEVKSLNDAVNVARQKLQSKGMTPPKF